ncbi:FACT complex subunit spt16, partial [Fragariocoptes setiger]
MEDTEIQHVKKACELSEYLYTKYVCPQLETIIDEEKVISHSKLSQRIIRAASDKKYLKGHDPDIVDTCYDPIIQSGGNYNLRFKTISDDSNIHFGFIICNLGMRYRGYCSNIARTLMITPTEEQKEIYKFLLKVEEQIFKLLVDGAQLNNVYDETVEFVKKNRPELVDKLTKNFGFRTGKEFRDGTMVIGPKTMNTAKKKMVFIITVGFQGLTNEAATDPKAKLYALLLSDTVLVNEGSPATPLTSMRRDLEKTTILLKEGEDDADNEDQDDDGEDITESLTRNTRNIIPNKLRSDITNEEKRKQHQRELLIRLNEAAKARLAKKTGSTTEEKVRKSASSYKSLSAFPRTEPEVRELKIFVDKKNETVILPIFGLPVPFHISTIKNISQSVEGDYTYLRINFFHPGSTLEKGCVFSNPDATFLKELTYRSSNIKEPGEINPPSANLSSSFSFIKAVQKEFKNREAEERELEGVVKQDTLILSQRACPKLKDLFIRPNIYTKRISGALEAHVNGFRFTSIRGDKVDILYNNIRHAIYQPCDGEMIILLHFNLKNPIMINKKKHDDIQFYTEVGEITTDLGRRQHMHDRDDYAAEQAERELRTKLKHAFKSFCDKVDVCSKNEVSFEEPLRELGFHGVPGKSNVFLQPTGSCLVNLTDWPPFVITLSDIELVHCERVSFHLKAFDMVIIFKDYNRKVANIGSVPMQKLDQVRSWLDRCDIKYTEGVQTLHWAKIMKTIVKDPDGFFADNGWAFLDNDAASDEEQEGEEETDDDGYEPEESEEEDEDESDFSEEEEDDASDEESGSEDLGSSEESGKDWSDLEAEAERADRNHREFEDDYSNKKKKPQLAHSSKQSNGTKRKSGHDHGSSKKRR